MSGIRRGRRSRFGTTRVPNWRWEDPSLDSYELRIAGWIASHADDYLAEHVTRNDISRATGISGAKASSAVETLVRIGLIEVEASGPRGAWVITFHEDIWVDGKESSGRHTTSHWSPHDQTNDLHLSTAEEQRDTAKPDDENGSTPVIPKSSAAASSEVFEKFWASWPQHRRREKPKARAAFARTLARGDCSLELLRGAFLAYQAHWARNQGSDCPYPAKWLTQEYWIRESWPVASQVSVEAPRETPNHVEDHGLY